MVRIAMIDNLSARAFRLIPPDFPAEIVLGPPSKNFERMLLGRVDAALAPVARGASLSTFAEPLGAYGIACLGAVSSVRLFTRTRLADLMAQQGRFHATPQSQTSRALLECLCCLDFGRPPRWCEDPRDADARLLIGEDALDGRREEHTWPGHHDMGQWWHERTGLPFIFARWVVRADLPSEDKDRLARWLEQSAVHATTPEGMDALVESVLCDGRCPLSPEFLHGYYARIRPRLTLRDLRGLERFLQLRGGQDACIQSA